MVWSLHSLPLVLQAPEDDEEEDFKVLSSDNLLLVGRADDEFSSIEVHGECYETESLICQHFSCFLPLVFSEDDFHSYSHHEILLTSFPLALEWTDYDPGEPDKKGCPISFFDSTFICP